MSNRTTRLIITGMNCGHCVASVEKALNAVNGVIKVEVTLEPGEAIVSGDAKLDSLITAVSDAGFEAQVA